MVLTRIPKRLLKSALIARGIVVWALRLHNWAYKVAGGYSKFLETDGLHPKHRIMKYHDWFKRQVRPEWVVLDIGCGNGALSYDLKEACKSVVGIDINPRNIDIASSQFSKKGITYICGDATAYAFDQQFDAIVLSNVLEHIENRVVFLKRIFSFQDQERSPVLLLRVPMLTRDWITPYKKEMGVEWRLDKTHMIEYTIDTLKGELEAAGLVLSDFKVQFGELYGVVKKK